MTGRGRPMLCPRIVLVQVITLHRAGLSDTGIADTLNREGTATPAGGPRWQRCHVWRLRRTAAALRLMAATATGDYTAA